MASEIYISMGDRRGIGAAIIFGSLREMGERAGKINIIGDSGILMWEASRGGFNAGSVNIIDVAPSGDPGKDALNFLDRAMDEVLSNPGSALVTAPVQKEAVDRVHKGFRGHTEYIASRCGVKNPVMAFVSSGNIKISLLTRHIPLKDVPEFLSRSALTEHIRRVTADLKKYFNIKSPRIALCSLNPHRGEGGLIGEEERKIIKPAADLLRDGGVDVRGPLNASQALKEVSCGSCDFAVSIYHDQLLPAIKALDGPSVNLTMGLPFIRTSPDHGPALDLPPGHWADHSSMKKAIELAVSL